MPASALVLSIDDDAQNLELIRDVGESIGWRVVTEQVATQAVSKARTLRPDVILLDVMMKEVGGLEVLASIKKDPDLAMTPVVFVSATVDPDVERRAIALGATDFIHKPFRVLALQSRVVSALHLSLLQSPRDLEIQENIAVLALDELVLRSQAGEPAGGAMLSFSGWPELVTRDRPYARRLLETLTHRLRRNIRGRDGIYVTRDGHILFVFPGTPKEGLLTVTQRLTKQLISLLAEKQLAGMPESTDGHEMLSPRFGLVSLNSEVPLLSFALLQQLELALSRANAEQALYLMSDDRQS